MSSHDDIGPEVVMHLYDPETDMRAVIVLDSLVLGPAKGGIRMSLSADEEEVCGLARAMTLKNALANLPFGGGKSGILADAKDVSADEKRALVSAFAKKLSLVAPNHYVAAPDIAMAEDEMRIIASIAGNSSVTGKPEDIGGIPHELGSTGYGVFVSVREVVGLQDESLSGKRVSVQGFGNVGSFAAKFLVDEGAVLVAASDSSATLTDESGLDVGALMKFKESGGRFSEYDGYEKRNAMHALFVDCDVLIPAAQRHVITEDNYSGVKAALISQGANLPIEPAVERLLEQDGVVVIPDILANAGGVISSWIEHEGRNASEVFDEIDRIISENIGELQESILSSSCARDACVALAKRRIQSAKDQ